jgi:hypothetical protein
MMSIKSIKLRSLPAAAALCALVAGCAGSPAVPAVRFANAPPVAAVDDRRDVPATPESRDFLVNLYHYDAIAYRRLERALEVPRPRRALGTNALDEVPDSTWFTNRIGARDMSLAELAAGPNTIDSPELHKPWKVLSTKVGGGELGFVFQDARGEKFLIKFDPPNHAEEETATHIIVGRILWACGFNVTEDFIVHLKAGDLVVAHDAKMTDNFGDKHPLDRDELLRRLADAEVGPGGQIRALASRWVDGKTLGGHPAEGVRDDDPNDRIPHQLRRDLRGAYAMFSWLDHVDIQESNFLDAWVTDRGNPRIHYVKHYLIDFGKSLGVMSSTGHDPRRGHSYVIDLADMATSLVELGLVPRSWEGRSAPKLRGLGLYEAASYDPGKWVTDYPVYVPFLAADRIDQFWASKILMRFSRDQLRAIVEAGELSDPRAVAYLTDTLVARQRATAAHWFARVNPIDRFTAYRDQLCFDDLAIAHRFDQAESTRYEATRFDREARELETSSTRAADDGRACVPLALPAGGDGYTMLRITTVRPGFRGATFVHVARDPTSGAPRVIGIYRM